MGAAGSAEMSVTGSVHGVMSCVTIALKTSDHTVIIIIIIIIIILVC